MKVFSIIHNPCFVKALSLILKVKNDSILEQQQLKNARKRACRFVRQPRIGSILCPNDFHNIFIRTFQVLDDVAV